MATWLGSVPDISVVMALCAWPDPSDMGGAPHVHLSRALDSVVEAMQPTRKHTAVPTVEVIAAVDGNAWRVVDRVEAWAAQTGVPTKVVCCEKASVCTWGNRQRNHVLDRGLATGRLIVWQDQDDRFAPGALTTVHALATEHPNVPLVFKMMLCHWDPVTTLWQQRGHVAQAAIGGHMLVVPNVPKYIARWLPETEHDADFPFIRDTLQRFADAGHEAVWSESLISILRPYLLEFDGQGEEA